MDELSDLVQRTRNGDKEAESRLFEQLRPFVRKAVEQYVRAGRIDASDITQQSLMQVLKSIPEYQGSSDPQFKRWLKTIVLNKIRDELRRTKPAASLDRSGSHGPLRNQISGGVPTPSKRMMGGEDARQLADALAELPDDQREAVRLRHLEGLSIAEIAERLEKTSEPAVRQLVRRGIVRLQALMNQHSEGDGG